MGDNNASAPPVIITSHMPARMQRSARPMASVAEVQAEATTRLGPVIPYRMANCPTGLLAISLGMNSGSTPAGPRAFSLPQAVSNACTPPKPTPSMMPVRSGCRAPVASRPASRNACIEAIMANTVNGSMRRTSRRSR